MEGFFFFKQKTAYDMRISDWSSDVCSSDLLDSEDATVAAFESAATALNIPFKTIRDTYADGRADYERRLILVRPDQSVVWTANTPPEEDRKSVVSGKRGSVRVDLGGGRYSKKTKNTKSIR